MRSESITVNALYRSARSCINTCPMGSCLYQINSSGCALGFICSWAGRYRRYLSYKSGWMLEVLGRAISWAVIYYETNLARRTLSSASISSGVVAAIPSFSNRRNITAGSGLPGGQSRLNSASSVWVASWNIRVSIAAAGEWIAIGYSVNYMLHLVKLDYTWLHLVTLNYACT